MLRQAATEPAFNGEYTDPETVGVYPCSACRAKLFTSATKFDSGCGWPCFYDPNSDAVEHIEDNSSRDESGRGALRPLRLAPRARLPRRVRDAHRRPLLHQLDQPDARAGRQRLSVTSRRGGRVRRSRRSSPYSSSAHACREPSSYTTSMNTCPLVAEFPPARRGSLARASSCYLLQLEPGRRTGPARRDRRLLDRHPVVERRGDRVGPR